MTKLAKKILTLIKQRSIKPRPRWIFQAQNIVIWLALIIWTVLGALASAMVIDQLRFNDWSLAIRLGGGLAIKSLPYFWLATLLLAIILAKAHFQRTKHGYRHAWFKITALCLLISLTTGLIIAYSGWGRQLDNQLAKKEIYRQLNCQDNLWYQPDNGLLTGTIQSINDDELSLTAPDKTAWLIQASQQMIAQQTPAIQTGRAIKILGQVVAPLTFKADEIRPYGIGCGCGHCRCNNCQK